MDIELMINSAPKLLNATLITLKLLAASLFFGLFVGLFFAWRWDFVIWIFLVFSSTKEGL